MEHRPPQAWVDFNSTSQLALTPLIGLRIWALAFCTLLFLKRCTGKTLVVSTLPPLKKSCLVKTNMMRWWTSCRQAHQILTLPYFKERRRGEKRESSLQKESLILFCANHITLIFCVWTGNLQLPLPPRRNFFSVLYSTLLHLPPLRFRCVGGCWDRTAGQLRLTALAVRRSNHSARSHPRSARYHPQLCLIASTTRLDLIHTRLDLIRTRLDLIKYIYKWN